MIDTQKKSLANAPYVSCFLSICLFFSLSRFLRGQTDTRDKPETRVVNKHSIYHVVREAASTASASTDGYLFSESCLMFGCTHD